MKCCYILIVFLLVSVSYATEVFTYLDNEYLGDGFTRFGAGHMAVETVLYQPADSIPPSEHVLLAVSMGNNIVKLYTFDTDSGVLAHSEDLEFQNNVNVFNISFIQMPTTDPSRRQWCLVARAVQNIPELHLPV